MSLSLSLEDLKKFSNHRYFVETGTYTGGGVQLALDAGFTFVHSIEIAPIYQQMASKRFASYNNVTVHLGDSVQVLPSIIENIDEPITFFLDSHFFSCSPAIVNGRRLSDLDVPLNQELDIIANHKIKSHTILIDDVRVFGESVIPGEPVFVDWTGISEERIKEKLLSINKDYILSYLDSSNGKKDILVAEVPN